MTEATHLTHENLLEELRNVVEGQPLWPGDTVSHAGAYELNRLGLIRRNADGDWIPTPAGTQCHLSGSISS